MTRIEAGRASDIAPRTMKKVTVEGRDILIANVDGKYYATDDSCTHSGASLSEGKIEGCTITCGWHGAEFDCQTGSLSKFPAKIRNLGSYTVVAESDVLFLEM